jgi:hypothetical protein
VPKLLAKKVVQKKLSVNEALFTKVRYETRSKKSVPTKVTVEVPKKLSTNKKQSNKLSADDASASTKVNVEAPTHLSANIKQSKKPVADEAIASTKVNVEVPTKSPTNKKQFKKPSTNEQSSAPSRAIELRVLAQSNKVRMRSTVFARCSARQVDYLCVTRCRRR